ncbi:MAG: GIY-YIG nuclease family protein [Verrucomicrobia bacterium]|nr:GIY-YIG nuclease family protein [Verrucomicrobiota bacterium]
MATPRKITKVAKARSAVEGQPGDVAAIRAQIQAFLRTPGGSSGTIGASKFGVYAFYDYDGEPIYIGQTFEGLGARISRHLTNQRTDAVAMNVLDPFEVAEICVWPLDLGGMSTAEMKVTLDRAEYTLYQKVINESRFNAVLNEKKPGITDLITLPDSYRATIIPNEIFPQRKHPDVRLARRASTIASLARVISERKVTKALRTTLLTQARRLEKLAEDRLAEFAQQPDEPDKELESDD